ncbi:hypothetical protein CROQUDRAFT_111444 [Cronartium quercuum f. sp. fusiforme G11]|uniref:Uncharacterized protein n=1 Tax=Cronartium quercuum f. sp. fusiforme G11 TaxID=708437 RepID=A0A9P6N5P3_9BASI|nr:hypothetical protein CROQUDRAFT_111444 [Cronartium quercuum f. sp. fusiforme G11]
MIHIKAMWGMLEANALPLPADPRSLEQFSQSFNTFKQVECVLEDAAAANLVSEAEVKVLKQGREGKIKLAPGMLFLDEVVIGMVTLHLAKLGIYIWGPDLTETADSLFNSALAHFKKESIKPGSHTLVTQRSVILRRRQRDIPTQYKNLLLKPSAHSDDEGLNHKADILSGKSNQKHPHVLPKVPIPSTFMAPPTQLPINFYKPSWFNALPPGQKEKLMDSMHVALLPNAAESLLPNPHPAESLSSSKFNKKYYEQLIQPYQLVTAAESDEEDLEQWGNLDYQAELDDNEGEGIDLTMASDGEDYDDDEYYAEGEFGALYDDEDIKWLESDVSEEEDNCGGEVEESEDEQAVDLDGDLEMKGKGKGKA